MGRWTSVAITRGLVRACVICLGAEGVIDLRVSGETKTLEVRTTDLRAGEYDQSQSLEWFD